MGKAFYTGLNPHETSVAGEKMSSKPENENVDEVVECPDCKGTHLKRDYDHAEIVCADCGLVLEDNIVDTGPEWRAFDMQQENALARAGPPM